MSQTYDYLIDHALKNVWSTPRQDRQSIERLAKITPQGGVWNKVRVLWTSYTLPLQGTRFHVYQIGQLHPLLLGLFPEQYRWIPFSEACNKQNLIVDLYAKTGVQLPRTECWYRWTANKNLIVAVKEQPRIPFNLDTEDLFMRVYTNAYFQGGGAMDNEYIKVEGATPLNTQTILDLQAQFQDAQTKPGATYAFVNGYRVSTIDLFTVKVGDIVEFVYDSSVKRVVDFTLEDLRTFDSIKDVKRKYLLHYPGPGDSVIDFHDDIDVFLLNPIDDAGRYKGVFYHRNQEDAMRMVTHKDYAIPVAYVLGYAADNNFTAPDKIKVRLHIRKSGWNRPLVDEDHRIKELYKLPDDELRDAMLGVNSVIDIWRADELENSDYCTIMATDSTCLSKAIVEDAYGYNAISKVLADTPKFVRMESTQPVVDVPYGLFRRSTGYEFDVNGFLIGWAAHVEGSVYPTRFSQTKLVEMIAGLVDDRLDEVYGDKVVTLDPTASYRMYTCDIVGGVPNEKWTDVTGTGQYAVINNVLTWLVDQTKKYTLVRGDRVSLGYSLDLDASDDGILKFTLSHLARRNNAISRYTMSVPMGELALWLNRKALIEGVDYFVNFPEICIVNKEYLVDPQNQTQHIDIRFCGFCKSDLSREVPNDVGFIKHGLLSSNNRFDIRDDKVMHMVVDGALYDRSELLFAEDDAGVTVPDARNGKPYLITDIVVPMRGQTQTETYALRTHSREVDKKVSDYLTLKIPEPVIPNPNIIPGRYQVFSPMCCKILYDLKNGVLDDPRLKQQYSDFVVKQLCAPYLPLLKYDPTQAALAPDDNYVEIHPHNLLVTLDISIYHWKFLQRVIKLYLRDKVQLSHFVTITTL